MKIKLLKTSFSELIEVRLEAERRRVEQVELSLETERQKAERLAAQLRTAGIEPEV